MLNVINIINTLRNKILYLRTLDYLRIDQDTISVGNNAVTVRCHRIDNDLSLMLKCYYRHKTNLKDIYGDNFYSKELGIYSIAGNIEYIDIVLLPWVDGVSLDRFIGEPNSDYAALSRSFDRLALETLEQEYAHGDIKPDNIIVGRDLRMTLIDFDAMWHPKHPNTLSYEIGTTAYCHPKRIHNYYQKSIDDYPLAIISTMLAAMALDHNLAEQLHKDKTLFSPEECVYGNDRMLNYVIELFKQNNDTYHKQIAQGLRSITPLIHDLHKMFYAIANGTTQGYKTPEHLAPKTSVRRRILSQAHSKATLSSNHSFDDRQSNRWSEDEDTKLALLLFDGNKIASIARYMGRSETAIRNRAKKLNIPLSQDNLRKPAKVYNTACKK